MIDIEQRCYFRTGMATDKGAEIVVLVMSF
jgi:hypothetical protein